MNWRRDAWSERLSAIVLLAAGVLVSGWSRQEIAVTHAALDRREAQLEQLVDWWSRGDRPGSSSTLPDLDGLFGGDESVVLAWCSFGPHPALRTHGTAMAAGSER